MNARPQHGESRSSLWSQWVGSCAGLTSGSRRHFVSFTVWELLWAASLATVAFAREFDMEPEFTNLGGVAIALAAIPFALACLTLRAYARFLRSADELTQKIQMEGLKMGLVFVVIYLSVHPLAEHLGVGPTQFPTPLFLVLIGHGLGQVLAARRYR